MRRPSAPDAPLRMFQCHLFLERPLFSKIQFSHRLKSSCRSRWTKNAGPAPWCFRSSPQDGSPNGITLNRRPHHATANLEYRSMSLRHEYVAFFLTPCHLMRTWEGPYPKCRLWLMNEIADSSQRSISSPSDSHQNSSAFIVCSSL